jgi:hypothetical protein
MVVTGFHLLRTNGERLPDLLGVRTVSNSRVSVVTNIEQCQRAKSFPKAAAAPHTLRPSTRIELGG